MNKTIPSLRALATVAMLTLAGCVAAPTTPPDGSFRTPEEAVSAMAALIGQADTARVEAMFGPGSMEMFRSGDPEGDRHDFLRVKAMTEQKVAFEDYDENTKVALLGASGWPWPIPLVRKDGFWRFDTESGRQELLNRRIGANELWTLAALHEIVDAQAEYRSGGYDGNPPAYAARFISSEGKRDGLWWPANENEPPSPLGDLLAESEPSPSRKPRPFHGYYFRLLDAQGPGAPGGERSYRDASGRMSGGFAVIAWPAKHGNSGVMTFLVNHRGIVFQKDLGDRTAEAAAAIQRFDLDDSWEPTADTVTDAEQAPE